MNNTQHTREEEISATKSLLASSYDLSSGGIPPETSLLEELLKGGQLTEYAKRTFSALEKSNLLFIPGLTVYLDPENVEEAIAYFGEAVKNEIDKKIESIGEMALRGYAAIMRSIVNPEISFNFEPISIEERKEMIEKLTKRGYLSKEPLLPEQWAPRSLIDLVNEIYNGGGALTKDGLNAVTRASKQWFSEPFFNMAVTLHIQKLGVMIQILRYAITKVDELGFADPTIFDLATYFGPSHNDSSKRAMWDTNFQKYFGRAIPGATGLLEWAQGVLALAKEKYS